MHLRSLYRCACLLAFIQLAAVPAYAADKQQTQTNYAVDIVVFEDSQASYLNSEKWPLPPHPAAPSVPSQTTAQPPANVTEQAQTTGQPPAQNIASSTSTVTPVPATDSTTAAASTTVPGGALKIPPTDVFLANSGTTPASGNSSTNPTATSNAAANTGAQNTVATTPPEANPDIHAIDPGKYNLLNNDVKRLIASPNYHVLVRKSWIQPGLDSQHAVSIDMSSADDPDSAGAIGTLTGSVKIVLERYLHLYTDLVYHRPSTNLIPAGDSSTPPAPEIQDFVIKQHRRMRSGELHYLDHPLVGILIKIVPVETKSDSQPAQ